MIRARDPMVDPALERRLRISVRGALKRNPYERRRARQLRWGAAKSASLSVVFFTVIAVAGTWASIWQDSLSAGGRLGVASVVSFCIALVRRQVLWTELYSVQALWVWSVWPVGNAQAFERQSSCGLRGRWICDLMTIAVCASLVGDVRLGVTEAIGLAGACFALRLVSQAVASVLALSSRWLLAGYIGLASFLVQLYARRVTNVSVVLDQFWNATGDVWSMVLPTGWVLRALQGLLTGGSAWSAAWMVPAAAMVWAMPWALRRMQAAYEYRDAVLLQYAAEPPDSWGEDQREILQSTLVNLPTEVSHELLARLRAREFLMPTLQAPEALDRLFLRLLTDRERTVLDWAQAGPVHVARNIRRAILSGIAGSVLAYGLCRAEPGHGAGWFVAVGTVFLMLWALRSGFLGRAFEPVMTMALQSPRVAFVPVSLAEVARLVVKLASFYVPVAVPLMAGAGAGLGWSIGHEPADLARIGAGLGLVLPGISLLLLMMPSSGPGPITWRGLLAGLVLVGPPVVGFLGCLAVLLFWESPWSLAVAMAGNLLMAVAFAGFRWMHQRRLFDLIGPVQS